MDGTAGSDIESGIGSSSATGVSQLKENCKVEMQVIRFTTYRRVLTYTRLYRGGMINLLVCSYKKSVAFEYYIATSTIQIN